MGEGWTRSSALTEVNRNILLHVHDVDYGELEWEFFCECADDRCTERLPALDLTVYRRVREQPRLFIVLPGHEDPQLARVVEDRGDYLIVEKIDTAGEVAERTQR